MVIYIGSALLSLILISVACRSALKKSRGLFWIISFIALLPTSIVSGVRSLTVGTDIQHYITTNFEAAQQYNSLFSYVSYIHAIKTAYANTVNHTEPGYSVLVYTVSRVTNNVHWLLFVLQFLTIVFIYVGLVKLSKRTSSSITFGMFVYYMLFWGPSLNIMRQTLAAAIVFCAVSYLVEERWISGAILILLACQFHMSALIGFAYMLILKLQVSKTEHDWSMSNFPYERFIVLLFAFTGMFILGPYLFQVLEFVVVKVPFLSKYTPSLAVLTLTGYRFIGTILFVITDFIVIGIYSGYGRSKAIENSMITNLFFTSMVISVMLFAMYKFQIVIPRLAIYFSVMRIASYPYFIRVSGSRRISFSIKWLLTIVLMLLFIYNLKTGSGAIYPYRSDVLGIY